MVGYQELCRAARLDAPRSFWEASEEAIAAVYNGAGPDEFNGWPRWFLVRVFGDRYADDAGRAMLTQFLNLYWKAFVIHDWRYAVADGTLLGFVEANEEMRRNMKKLLNQAYPLSRVWTWPLRARWYLRLRAAYAAVCSDAGWEAWRTMP